ncbi:MAG: hypothetical protein ACQET5_09250 [Halobacteriota archaeon]
MIPDGELRRSRVISELSPALERALDQRLDGYALLFPRNALLGDVDECGVITFETGVARLAYHTGTDRGGPTALADIGSPPYRFELYALDADALELPHRTDELRIPPGAVADRLANDPELAGRIRGPANDPDPDDIGAVEAFLDDAEAVSELRADARRDALDRADEWGFADALDG